MKKVYSIFGVRIGTFIGGPLTGGYLLSENFKAIGRADLARRILLLAILITIAFIATLAALSEVVIDKVPNILFPGLFSLLASHLFDRYQKEAIERLLEEQEGTQISNWKAVSISLLFMIVTLLLLFLLILL